MPLFMKHSPVNTLEQRLNKLPEAGALHLTRSEDLLNITLEKANINIYQPKEIKGTRYDSNIQFEAKQPSKKGK